MRCEVPRSGDSLRFCGAVALRFGARRGRVGQRVVSASCRVEWMRLFFSTCGFVRYICRALVCFVCVRIECDTASVRFYNTILSSDGGSELTREGMRTAVVVHA